MSIFTENEFLNNEYRDEYRFGTRTFLEFLGIKVNVTEKVKNKGLKRDET